MALGLKGIGMGITLRQLSSLHDYRFLVHLYNIETLIVWSEDEGVDLALSFQEAEGCGEIW
jgi:hypothetical protein